MRKTVKIAVSMSKTEYKNLEARRRKSGKTRSQLVRDALLIAETSERRVSAVKQEKAAYERPESSMAIDREERIRRAIAVAGRFRSDLTDLAANHDRYLEDAFATEASADDAGKRD